MIILTVVNLPYVSTYLPAALVNALTLIYLGKAILLRLFTCIMSQVAYLLAFLVKRVLV